MRVLVFGRTGQVAAALARSKWPERTALTFLDRSIADLSEPGSLGAMVRSHQPDSVIIAAAYTAVDHAEQEERLATVINAEAPAAIAQAAAELSAPVVYISSDYVFDGEKPDWYREADPVGPLSAYGRSKLAGEAAVQSANPHHLILRTSWIYSATGKNFLRTMLRLAESRDEVGVVADQHGCPTAAGDFAQGLARVLPGIVREGGPWGTYHLAGGSATTWHGFAEAIFRRLAERGRRRPLNRPINTADFPTPARRPRNSRLSSDLFAETFGVRLPGFQTSLPAIVDATLEAIPLSDEAAA